MVIILIIKIIIKGNYIGRYFSFHIVYLYQIAFKVIQ